jgi:hypothetical protein
MYQLSQTNTATLNVMRQRATGRCLLLPNRELPPGASPTRARIGLEVAEDGTALLLVDKDIRYEGPVASIRQWLNDGALRFDSFDQLRRWLCEDIRNSFHRDSPLGITLPPGLRSDWPSREDAIPVVGRELIIEQIDLALHRRFQPAAPLLVGARGVGKTAICQEVARRWQDAAVGNFALRVDLPVLLSGAVFSAERTHRSSASVNWGLGPCLS